MTPANGDPAGLPAYQAAMRDLLGPSQWDRRILWEFRSRQRDQLVPFIHMDSLNHFMHLFYPLVDEQTSAAITGYVGQSITVAFPWRHPRLFDLLPLINFLRDSPQMNLVTWWYNGRQQTTGALAHGTQIATTIFGRPRANIDMPNANSFQRIMFRSHNFPLDHNHARLEIWFRQPTEQEVARGVDNLDWVDGNDWVWPKNPDQPTPGLPPPSPPVRRMTRATAEREKRRKIEAFLRATGLYFDEIRATWNVFIDIDGKHQRGGKGIKR